MKTALVLGGGGFIGGHLAKKLKEVGCWVCVVDIKEKSDFWQNNKICHKYISGDLRDPNFVTNIMKPPNQANNDIYDEVYQLAADMGGAGYIFSGNNDADVMYNSGIINLNIAKEAVQKKVKKIFFSSSACVYSKHKQIDSLKPNCKESEAYPADPDSEYGWEKLFSERMYLSFAKNYDLNVRIARFHNIFGPHGQWRGGKEKAPAAICRKAIEAEKEIKIWGDGMQTRSFLYIDECVEGILRLMRQNKTTGPINIGSEEMVTINELAKMIISISGKDLLIKHIEGPVGVRGRNSDNELCREKLCWEPSMSLFEGITKTYHWIQNQIKNS